MSMAMDTASSRFHLRPPPSSPAARPRFPPENLQLRKRRRLKVLAHPRPTTPIMFLPFDSLFHGLLSALPSPTCLDLVVPALGFASGAAFYFSTRGRDHLWLREGEASGGRAGSGAVAVGDWILFSSPTPFNRCVLLRCPSVWFEDGGELLEGVNDRLVREERHYVNLSRGRILADPEAEGAGDDVSYQRLCVGTGDGGVISLDWPQNLELGREQGLDTTVLLVPGTAQGSMDGNIRAFVHDALRHGCFPIVMNPRGCAGSPLTTPRLFTAADSDDISTAIQFINKSRPWTTLMGIGWGYGANMLTKYLAEVGEQTPLTAAVCIDNPFDLNEATKLLLHHTAKDKKLTGGLVEILRANKELFQGKNSGFDVVKALSAETVCDFEGAISMISHGFEAIEDFYTKCGTRQLVHKVKIPLLFIQSDDETVPLFSIPRSSIAENPFTSLLSCSCSPSNIMRNDRSTIMWCQNLAIEWLSAVELALLKGRHPLLKDVDITITPTKRVAMLEGRLSEKGIPVGDSVYDSYIQNKKRGDLLKLPNSNAASGFLTDPISTLLEKNDNAYPGKANDNGADLLNDTGGSQEISLVDAGSGKEGSEDPANSERSQVLGAAAVILNMLDVTMPGTLGNEQKEKVLTAMEQGETLMKALQGAVPEDVRWKLTAAVSEIVQTQGTKINIDNLKKIGWVPRMPSTRKSKIQEQPRDISTADGPNGAHFADHRKTGASIPESLHGDSVSHHISDHDAQENIDSSQEKSLEASRYTESMTKVDGKQSQYGEPDVASGSLDTSDRVVNQSHRVDERHDDCRAKLVADDSHYSETKKLDAVAGDKMANSSSNCEQSHTSDSSSVEHQQSHKERNDVQEINNENVQHSIKFEEPLSNDSNHSSGNPPPISVSQALDALTGFDDSTQMAVNSVFGVIESMIDQLEKGKDKLDGEESKGGVLESDDSSEQSLVTSNHKSDNVYAKNASGLRSDVMQSDPPQDSFLRKPVDPREDMRVRRDEKKLIHDLNSSDSGAFGRFLGTNFNFNKDGSLEKVLLNFNVNPYWESPCRAYLHKYFSSQMSNRQALNSQSATDLFLDPEEGRWKMLDQMESSSPIHNMEEHQGINVDQMSQSMLQEIDKETIIEPSYAILDTEQSRIPANNDKQDDHDYFRREELALLVKYTVLDALKVEVARRLGMLDLKEADSGIKHDLERISDAVSCAVLKHSELSSEYKESSSAKLGTIQGQWIIRTISYVVHDTSHLGKVLPAGVIVGSTLASLRKYFHVTVLDDELKVEAATDGPISFREKHSDKECDIRNAHDTLRKKEQNINLDPSDQVVSSTVEISTPRNDRAMVGAVTVALGASALLAHHQTNKAHMSTGLSEISSNPMKVEESSLKLHDKLVEVAQDKTQNNLITTLAEKAMSVAGPVVPTKNDGEVDHERLIATLAELGQKGGMLRLIGKIALLWGGIRGAMSLTDRLISFLHIAERPLFQRILGFVSMVLVMWSPVVIPLLPTLVESWTLKRFTGIAEYACIAGLYVAIMILVVLWGRRIRGYENPLKQYGLDLRSASQVRDFTKGFLGGTMLVLYVHSVSALLGYACLVRPSDLPSSSVHVAMLFKTYGWMLIQTLKGVVTAACIAIVEELLFRSWLPDEIAVDLGYRRSIIISGILFSLLQRSLTSIPGFLFLSLALFGAKQRGNGSLLLPIGIRTGIMTANFVVQTGGFLTYRSATPFWLASTHPWHPFDGAVGLGICILMAVFLYPRRPTQGKENSRVT